MQTSPLFQVKSKYSFNQLKVLLRRQLVKQRLQNWHGGSNKLLPGKPMFCCRSLELSSVVRETCVLLQVTGAIFRCQGNLCSVAGHRNYLPLSGKPVFCCRSPELSSVVRETCVLLQVTGAIFRCQGNLCSVAGHRSYLGESTPFA